MSKTEQWVILLIAAIGCIALFFYLVPGPYERYYSRVTRDKMIGLTKEEVLQRVGNPARIIEQGDTWVYQLGKDPGTYLLFTEGKVASVDEWKK